MSKKKKLIDADGLKSIGGRASELGVPERWLRNEVATGRVQSVRLGYNVFVPADQTETIKKLAPLRLGRTSC